MPQWEYCEVAWTPEQIIVHMYHDRGMWYEGVQRAEDWGALLAQLGGDEWEMVSAVPTNLTGHTLYYFKRPLDVTTIKTQSEIRAEAQAKEEQLRQRAQMAEQKKAAIHKGAGLPPDRQVQPPVSPSEPMPATATPQHEQPETADAATPQHEQPEAPT